MFCKVSDLPDLNGRTALMWAAADPDCPVQVIRALRECGSDPARRDRSGATALHMAATEGNAPAAEELLSASSSYSSASAAAAALGASKDDSGRTPLAAAAQLGNVGVAEVLLRASSDDDDEGAGEDPLVHPVHLASESGRAEIVGLLLERRRDLRGGAAGRLLANAGDLYGRSPLIMASYGGYVECMGILLERVSIVWLSYKFG